jgi:2-dehydro-3-deoxygluconokinase
MSEARAGGALVSFDVNYRAKLWCPEEAAPVMSDCLARADLVFCSPDEVELIFGQSGAVPQVLEWLAREFGAGVIVLKLGADGAAAWEKGVVHRAGVHATETVDPVGSGDAFVAGFVYGYLIDGVGEGLRYGTAVAALKRTIPGDVALVTLDEVQELLLSQDQRIRR